jgi:hypothetical protein
MGVLTAFITLWLPSANERFDQAKELDELVP